MCNYCKKLGTLSMRLQEESNKVKIEWTRQRNSFCCRASIFGHNKCFGEWNMVHWLGSIMTPHISKKHFLWLQAHSSKIYVHGQQFYQEAIKNESVHLTTKVENVKLEVFCMKSSMFLVLLRTSFWSTSLLLKV
jgi:hypothetical protein